MAIASFRNFTCFTGLFLGAAIIMSADLARADVRPCTAEEAARAPLQSDLPVLCEVMTITAERPDPERGLYAALSHNGLVELAQMRESAADRLRRATWQVDLTS